MPRKRLTCRLYPSPAQTAVLLDILECVLRPEEFVVIEDGEKIKGIELRGQRIRARASSLLGDFLPRRGLLYRDRGRWHWLMVCEIPALSRAPQAVTTQTGGAARAVE